MENYKGFWKEYFVNAFNKTLAGGSGTVFESNIIRFDSDADFEFHKTIFTAADNRIYLKFKDEAAGRYLTKTGIDIRSIGGQAFSGITVNGFIPFVWPRPYLISAGSSFDTEAADFSTASNIIQIAYHGAKIRPGRAPWDRKFRAVKPFTYGGRVTVAANASDSLTIEIDTDAHFLVQRLTGIVTSSSGTISIKEGFADRDWFNIALNINNVLGNGQFPNIFTANRFLNRGSVLIVQIQDSSGSANTIEVNLSGVKLYE